MATLTWLATESEFKYLTRLVFQVISLLLQFSHLGN